LFAYPVLDTIGTCRVNMSTYHRRDSPDGARSELIGC
jgi:hypothetical protein